VLAHRRRDNQSTIDQLLAVRDIVRRIGGSHAQCNLFEEMLIASALRAGCIDQAKTLLATRLNRRPRNAWGSGDTTHGRSTGWEMAAARRERARKRSS
jgi:hypothetical protein